MSPFEIKLPTAPAATVFLRRSPQPQARALGHEVTEVASLLGHGASGQMAMCRDDVDRSGQPFPIGSQLADMSGNAPGYASAGTDFLSGTARGSYGHPVRTCPARGTFADRPRDARSPEEPGRAQFPYAPPAAFTGTRAANGDVTRLTSLVLERSKASPSPPSREHSYSVRACFAVR